MTVNEAYSKHCDLHRTQLLQMLYNENYNITQRLYYIWSYNTAIHKTLKQLKKQCTAIILYNFI